MNNESCLSIIAKEHKRWINIVRSLGEYDFAEDIVQELYLKIHKNNYCNRIIKDNKVNSGYMFLSLRSMLFDFRKEQDKYVKEDIKSYNIPCSADIDNEKEEAYLKICEAIDKEIDTWHWYDKEVFKIYRMHWRDESTLNRLLKEFDGKVSIRKMAASTEISWVTLFNELKESKRKIKEKFGEDWQDYINEDYHLI